MQVRDPETIERPADDDPARSGGGPGVGDATPPTDSARREAWIRWAAAVLEEE